MFRLDLGSARRSCDGIDRRSFLQLGVAGMASVGMPELLRAKARSASSKSSSVILIWLDGGPGHMDMYDMKPDAPAEYRGLWKPIRSKVPGFDITEMYPKQAKITDKFSVVRSLHHDTGDHFAGGHRMLTAKDMGVSGAATPEVPGIGALSIARRDRGSRCRGTWPFPRASIGPARLLRRAHARRAERSVRSGRRPNAAAFQVRNLDLAAGLTLEKLEDRRRCFNTSTTNGTNACRPVRRWTLRARRVRVRRRSDGVPRST